MSTPHATGISLALLRDLQPGTRFLQGMNMPSTLNDALIRNQSITSQQLNENIHFCNPTNMLLGVSCQEGHIYCCYIITMN